MSIAPTISCVIPVYNDKLHLPRAVTSALSQRSDVQVVLVDDCSNDGSRELALEMARDNPRIVAVPLSSNGGQGYARNIGVITAEAPYVTFLDQDDEHAPNWYNHAIELLEGNAGVAAIRGDIELMEVPPELSITQTDPRWPAMVNSTLWNIVMRKVVYYALGGCPTSRTFRTREGVEDVPLVAALVHHFSVLRTEHPATRHYVRPNNATAYFLKRTRVVGTRFEFLEVTDAERSGTLDKALLEFQAQAKSNIDVLRRVLQPRFKGFRDLLSRAAARLLRKLARI